MTSPDSFEVDGGFVDGQAAALVLGAAERMLERLSTEALTEDALFVRAQSLAELLESGLDMAARSRCGGSSIPSSSGGEVVSRPGSWGSGLVIWRVLRLALWWPALLLVLPGTGATPVVAPGSINCQDGGGGK